METGEFATDHDAIISLVGDMRWLKQHHEQFCRDNYEAHMQMHRDNSSEHERTRNDVRNLTQSVAQISADGVKVQQDHESRVSVLEERTRWLKFVWFGGGIGGIGGVGGLYAAIRVLVGN